MSDTAAIPAAPPAAPVAQPKATAKPAANGVVAAKPAAASGMVDTKAPSAAPESAAAPAKSDAPVAPKAPDPEDRYWERIKPMKVGDKTYDIKQMQFKNSAAFEAWLQKNVGGVEKFEAAAKAQKDADAKHAEIMEVLRLGKDPQTVWDMLKYLGHDPDQLAESRVAQDYFRDKEAKDLKAKGFSDEEIADLRYAKEARAREAAAAEEKKAAEAKAAQEARDREAQESEKAYRTRVIETAVKAINLLGFDAQGVHKDFAAEFLFPQTRNIVRAAEMAGIELTPERVAAELDTKINEIGTYSLSGLDGPALLKRLGQPTLDRIVKAIREGARSPAPAPTPAVGAPTVAPAPERPARRNAAAEERRRLEEMASGHGTDGTFRWQR